MKFLNSLKNQYIKKIYKFKLLGIKSNPFAIILT